MFTNHRDDLLFIAALQNFPKMSENEGLSGLHRISNGFLGMASTNRQKDRERVKLSVANTLNNISLKIFL